MNSPMLMEINCQFVKAQSALELGPSHCPDGRLGQDLGFGGFAFAPKLPELLNTNLAAVRAKLGQTSCIPIGPQIWFPIGQWIWEPNWGQWAQPSSPLIGLAKWAPFIALNFCCLGCHSHSCLQRFAISWSESNYWSARNGNFLVF